MSRATLLSGIAAALLGCSSPDPVVVGYTYTPTSAGTVEVDGGLGGATSLEVSSENASQAECGTGWFTIDAGPPSTWVDGPPLVACDGKFKVIFRLSRSGHEPDPDWPPSSGTMEGEISFGNEVAPMTFVLEEEQKRGELLPVPSDGVPDASEPATDDYLRRYRVFGEIACSEAALDCDESFVLDVTFEASRDDVFWYSIE